jgi:hypothetical protein
MSLRSFGIEVGIEGDTPQSNIGRHEGYSP